MINMFRKQQGQGLTETLMITVLIGLTVLAFISFQNHLSYYTELAQQKAYANLLAKAKIETLRYFSVLNTTAGYTAYQNITTGNESNTVGNTAYTINYTITSNTSPTYKNINLTVSWTDRRGNAQLIRYVTNIASVDPSLAVTYM